VEASATVELVYSGLVRHIPYTAYVDEGLATTVGDIARETDYQTDIPTKNQSDYSTPHMARALIVRPHSSGLSCHAKETRSDTSSQLSVYTTVYLTIPQLFAEDSAPASTNTDIFFTGMWEDGTIHTHDAAYTSLKTV